MRVCCNICRYPINTCLCNYVTPISLPINITIVQHVKEANHAKNTARLIKLCAPNVDIVNPSSVTAMKRLQTLGNATSSAILYPNPASVGLETVKTDIAKTLRSLIVIDGTWKQAYAIMQQHPWLKSLPSYHFDNAPKTKYRIRHTKVSQGLSTLEATAYALSTLYNIDVNGLYELQEAMQNNWQGPSNHQRNIDLN